MFDAEINMQAVLSGALISVVFSYLWYGRLFKKKFQELTISEKDGAEVSKQGAATRKFLLLFLANFLMGFILAQIITYMESYTLGSGITTGIRLWLGFVLTTLFADRLFSSKPKPILLSSIDSGYWFFAIIIMSGMIASWQ